MAADILILGIILLCCGLIIRRKIKSQRDPKAGCSGCSGCGGNCGVCSGKVPSLDEGTDSEKQ